MKIQYNKRHWKPGILSMMFFILFIQLMKAQLTDKYETYEQNSYKGMPYGLFKPANYDAGKSYPLIVYLHGGNDTIFRGNYWYKESVQTLNPSFVLTPKTTEHMIGWGTTWDKSNLNAQKKVLALVDLLIKNYSIDASRLYIYGIDMGATGVFSVLCNYPGKFAAAVTVRGAVSLEVEEKLLSTPLWIFYLYHSHIKPARLPSPSQIYEKIVWLGGKKVKYTECMGIEYDSWENVLEEKELSKWLFSQEKK